MIEKYSTFIFDCDGVILKSNSIKTEVFQFILSDFSAEKIRAFTDYHKANGGVTRQKKFEYFIKQVEKETDKNKILDFVLDRSARYSTSVTKALMDCALVEGVKDFIEQLSFHHKKLAVVTGGSEEEVKKIFKHKGIYGNFNLILGNPTSKLENMQSLESSGYFEKKSIYFGDSKLDWELANEFGCDFIFVQRYSEWTSTENIGLESINDFEDPALNKISIR